MTDRLDSLQNHLNGVTHSAIASLVERQNATKYRERSFHWIKMKLNQLDNENPNVVIQILQEIIHHLQQQSIPEIELAALDLNYDYDEEGGDDILQLNIGGKRVDLRREVFIQGKERLGESIFFWLGRKRWRKFLLRDKKRRVYLNWDVNWVQPIIDLFHYYSEEKQLDYSFEVAGSTLPFNSLEGLTILLQRFSFPPWKKIFSLSDLTDDLDIA